MRAVLGHLQAPALDGLRDPRQTALGEVDRPGSGSLAARTEAEQRNDGRDQCSAVQHGKTREALHGARWYYAA